MHTFINLKPFEQMKYLFEYKTKYLVLFAAVLSATTLLRFITFGTFFTRFLLPCFLFPFMVSITIFGYEAIRKRFPSKELFFISTIITFSWFYLPIWAGWAFRSWILYALTTGLFSLAVLELSRLLIYRGNQNELKFKPKKEVNKPNPKLTIAQKASVFQLEEATGWNPFADNQKEVKTKNINPEKNEKKKWIEGEVRGFKPENRQKGKKHVMIWTFTIVQYNESNEMKSFPVSIEGATIKGILNENDNVRIKSTSVKSNGVYYPHRIYNLTNGSEIFSEFNLMQNEIFKNLVLVPLFIIIMLFLFTAALDSCN